MGALSIWHWLIIAAVALLLFGGRGKLSQLMGDAAKGIKAFQHGLKEGESDHRDSTTTPSTSGVTAGTLPRTEAEQEALREAQAGTPAAGPPAQSAEPRA